MDIVTRELGWGLCQALPGPRINSSVLVICLGVIKLKWGFLIDDEINRIVLTVLNTYNIYKQTEKNSADV